MYTKENRMKKYTVVLIGLFTMMFAGCSKNAKMAKLLERKWKVETLESKDIDDGMVILRHMADTAKDTVMKMNIVNKLAVFLHQTDEYKKTSIVEYKSDKTFKITDSVNGELQTTTGTWKITDDGKWLISTNETGSDTAIILHLAEDEFTRSTLDGRNMIGYKALN